MELPEHTCISCAYLCEEADKYIPISGREQALDDKKWPNQWVNYQNCVCYEGELRSFRGEPPKQIRDEVIRRNSCKKWRRYISGISPIATEQQESSKWAKRAFWIALATLAVVVATWLLAQFVLG